jgi:UDP-2,3-diacylglucosamine hydrolase
MSTHFISDLHLDPSQPAITARLFHYLGGQAREASDLYVLGDLFEAWVGDDDDSELSATVATALAGCASAGVRIWFLHGNRDFLLGTAYAGRCGMSLLPEECVLEVEGVPTLLLHGDTLCTGDLAYQAFRRQARDREWQAAMLAQPLAVRRQLATAARAHSAQHAAMSAHSIMDVAPEAVAAAFARHGVQRMIHGHTHRPAVHTAAAATGTVERIVLGDWHVRGSVLAVDGERQALLEFDRQP